jgi:hypothetical protein
MTDNHYAAAIVRPDKFIYGVAGDQGTLNYLCHDLEAAVFGATDDAWAHTASQPART